LDKVEAFASLGFVLLSDVLGGVAKTSLLQKVILWTLIEAWVSIVFVRADKRHWLYIARDSQLVQLVQRVAPGANLLMTLLTLVGRFVLLLLWCGVV